MLNYIQPILDFSFYFFFGIYFQGNTDYENYYKIFAFCACTFYIFIFFPQKFSLIKGFTQIITYSNALVALVSFILSILISLENEFFRYCYWSTFLISFGIGSFLLKNKYKKE